MHFLSVSLSLVQPYRLHGLMSTLDARVILAVVVLHAAVARFFVRGLSLTQSGDEYRLLRLTAALTSSVSGGAGRVNEYRSHTYNLMLEPALVKRFRHQLGAERAEAREGAEPTRAFA